MYYSHWCWTQRTLLIYHTVTIPVQTSHSGPSSAHQIQEAKFYGGNKPPIVKALQKRITMKLGSVPHGITATLQSGIPQLVNWYVPCCYVWISSSLTRTRSSTLPLRIIILTKMSGHTEILLLYRPHDLVCSNWIYNYRWSCWHRCSCRHWPNSCRLVSVPPGTPHKENCVCETKDGEKPVEVVHVTLI